MNAPPISELAGKTIETITVYSDAILIVFSDQKTVATVTVQDEIGALRMDVGSIFRPDMPMSVRVYLGQSPYPKELGDHARRAPL